MPLNIVKEICSLQNHYSPENTDEMKRRGILIREDFSSYIKSNLPDINQSMGFRYDDICVEGKDGVGRKTDVPWVRFYSLGRSKSATDGWYCVYLFRADAKGVYLSLGHGSTRFENGSFVPRSKVEMDALNKWGFELVKHKFDESKGHIREINSGSTRTLGRSYENAVAVSKYYPLDSLPSAEILSQDIRDFSEMLDIIYQEEDLGRAPQQEDRMVADAKCQYRTNSGRQGYGLTGKERRIIELYAMDMATQRLKSLGHKTKDVSGNSSFDIMAKTDDVEFYVEVKGTTSGLGTVLLTYNEVELHKDVYPNNYLIVVYEIDLNRSVEPALASGGKVEMYHPWKINEANLKPINYEYKL
ncbi:MrcB family domain-containing protein [Vibrio lentus]|uniref:MrcB family domain-containing protein n=1 Tax=Vibrio lentus TaxID=136468 RepID=UPI000C862D65|nr:DUF3578 domain-containing protein [Vibrio lentus]PMI80503.1 hypothetical protein BCU36_16305 [Vibrio lentus]